MENETNKKVVNDFIQLYLKAQKSQYLKKELSQHMLLIEKGVLYEVKENKEVLEIAGDSIVLQEIVLDLAKEKLQKELPQNVSDAFKFIDEFDEALKKEHDCERVINSFSTLMRGLRGYILLVLHRNGTDIKSFMLSLDTEKRENKLYTLESSFFNYLPHFNYSENEIFELLLKLWSNEARKHDVVSGLRRLPSKDLEMSKTLLDYGVKHKKPLYFIAELLIGLYNAGDTYKLKSIIELKDNITCINILGRLDYKNPQDVEKALGQLDVIAFESIELASQQSYFIRNLLKNSFSTKEVREKAFKILAELIKNGTNEIVNRVIHDIYFLEGYDAEKYNLLHLYLSKTKNFNILKDYFTYFKDPKYIFDIMMRLFNTNPDFRFSTSLFENGIRHAWNTNQVVTEQQILYLFKHGSAFGVLGVKTIFTAYLGIFQVDLMKLDKAQFQITAINSICKHPHSFDKLLPLIMPLRNSKLKGVREHLQKNLSYKVFKSYHDTLFQQIKERLGKSKRDVAFTKPIKKALDDYEKLKELKESINDLNPYENERDLIDLYYRLEHEAQAKMMNDVNKGKGTFMEMAKNISIVRGNSWMIREGEVSPLGKFESSMLIDGSSYLNPDLYEYNLNNKI